MIGYQPFKSVQLNMELFINITLFKNQIIFGKTERAGLQKCGERAEL